MKPMKWTIGVGIFIFVLAPALIFVSASAAEAQIDKSRIYFGNPDNFKKPGEIKLAQVFRAIPEYKTIKKENIKSSDAKYWILMRKANKRFKAALVAVNRDSRLGYDLIGEIGSIKIDAEVPNITAEVIRKITGQSR